jgi:hypothetical protein
MRMLMLGSTSGEGGGGGALREGYVTNKCVCKLVPARLGGGCEGEGVGQQIHTSEVHLARLKAGCPYS